uniref:Uncharacterized protein n=1 Tax=Aegilops tauschii subsp. strangulata TaxID=200361 RepID=A0A453SDB9_AEGTS
MQLCIAVPCHIFKLWAFSGIMLQIPLLFLTKYLQDKFKNTMVCHAHCKISPSSIVSPDASSPVELDRWAT